VRLLSAFARETAGAARTRSSLRPLSLFGAEILGKSSGAPRGEIAKVCLFAALLFGK